MKLPLVVLIPAALAVLSTQAHSQTQIVQTQLDSAVVLMAQQGFAPSDAPVTGQLAAGADEELELALDPGSHYIVLGVCDGGCSDLDLVLTAADGTEWAADRELDDVPMLSLPGSTGVLFLSVQMASCGTDDGCHYGVQIFQSRE